MLLDQLLGTVISKSVVFLLPPTVSKAPVKEIIYSITLKLLEAGVFHVNLAVLEVNTPVPEVGTLGAAKTMLKAL